MNVSSSTDLMATAMSLSQPLPGPTPPPGGGDGGPSSYAPAIEALGGNLSNKARDSLYSGVAQRENAGASFEEIKSYVNSELEASGVGDSSGSSRSGQLVDMMA